jgi:hypothetical protein
MVLIVNLGILCAFTYFYRKSLLNNFLVLKVSKFDFFSDKSILQGVRKKTSARKRKINSLLPQRVFVIFLNFPLGSKGIFRAEVFSEHPVNITKFL